MTARFDLYATGSAKPRDLWAVVGNPWRLSEWTDLGRVDRVEPDPVDVGSEVVTVGDGPALMWRVLTAGKYLLELTAATGPSTLSVGWRVVRDPRGSRLILAGGVDVGGRAGKLRARTTGAPALRRRMDRWAARALQLAGDAPDRPAAEDG